MRQDKARELKKGGGLGIYVLGVQSNFRGKELLQTLANFDLVSEIVWGPDISVDSAIIEQSTNQQFANFTIHRDIKPQEVACCLGHIRMYSRFFESTADWGLFLEDDAICVQNPKFFLQKLPIIQNPSQIFIHDGPGTDLNLKSQSDDPLREIGVIRRLDPQYGAYGYLLNRSAVELILKSKVLTHINTPDWPYLWPTTIRFYQSKKIFFTHPNDNSMSIIGERINLESKLINQLPNISRVISGIKLGLSLSEVSNKELTVKLIRIFLQITRRMGFSK